MSDLKQPKFFFNLTRPAEHYNVYLWRERLEDHFKFLSIKYRHAKKIDDCHFSERVIMDEMLWCLVEVSQVRSEEHTSELQSLMRISYAVFCLKTKKNKILI